MEENINAFAKSIGSPYKAFKGCNSNPFPNNISKCSCVKCIWRADANTVINLSQPVHPNDISGIWFDIDEDAVLFVDMIVLWYLLYDSWFHNNYDNTSCFFWWRNDNIWFGILCFHL